MIKIEKGKPAFVIERTPNLSTPTEALPFEVFAGVCTNIYEGSYYIAINHCGHIESRSFKINDIGRYLFRSRKEAQDIADYKNERL